MAIRWTDLNTHDPLYLSTSAGTLTFSRGGQSNLSFDGEGRLVGAWFDHMTYRRGLDNRILMKWVEGRSRRRRRLLHTSERRHLLERAYGEAARLQSTLTRGRLALGNTLPDQVDAVERHLAEIGAWNWERLEAEAERFNAVYKPVSILPPDQYLALVVQATEGCSYNRCTFCTFYRDRPFRIKTLSELDGHLDRIRGFLGRGISLRRTLFLADANAVIIGRNHLTPILAAVNRAFPILPTHLDGSQRAFWQRQHPWHLKGIYAFVSAPDALRKEAREVSEMADLNVRRLYVGLETGHDPLRHFLDKPGTADDVLRAVHAIKAGGLGIGLILMVGIGGKRFRDPHLRDTVALIHRMPLDGNDLIYISPFVAEANTPYVADATAAGIPPLSEESLLADERRIRAALRPWARSRGLRISHYDVREFIY